MVQLTQIWIYPIKSLDGLSIKEATILQGGALEHDRQWAICDRQGQVVNAKRYPNIHRLRARFNFTNPQKPQVQLGIDRLPEACTDLPTSTAPVFDLHPQNPDLVAFLEHFFGFPVQLQENRHQGFPDDLQSTGPTLLSTATLANVAQWFEDSPSTPLNSPLNSPLSPPLNPPFSVEECRQRFRANLELDSPAFWEDRLFLDQRRADLGETVPFYIGEVEFQGVNPCLRCVVPSRHPHNGEITPQFTKIFSDRRRTHLPAWAEPSRFQIPYRLSVNTRIAASQAGKVLCIGDELRL